jgi:integrase
MEIPMHPSLKAVLTELAQESECRPSDYLFPDRAEKYLKRGSPPISGEWVRFLAKLGIVNRSRAFYKKRARVRARMRKAGKTVFPTRTRAPSELSFHSFRHSAVSLLKNIGAPEAVAMQIAGHESASISRIYTHIDEGSERRWIAKMPDFNRLALKQGRETNR